MIPKLTRHNLDGVWHALIVPWTREDELDEGRFAAEIRSYAGAGLDGMYTGGTTGEFYALDDDTFRRVTGVACEEAHALGLPIQIGCSALSTRTVCQRVRWAAASGADAIQLALPFWLECRPQDAAGFMHDVAAVADPLPLVLYQTSRAKVKLSPEAIGELGASLPAFIGMKDTGCDLPTLEAMLQCAPDLAIFGGDIDMIERMAAGGRGAYCSVTGLNAPLVVAIFRHIKAGRIEQARPLEEAARRLVHEFLLPLIASEGLLDSALDRLMRMAGGGEVGLRCQKPYPSATQQHLEELRRWCQTHAPLLLQYRPGA